jgi:putative ABC transport system permease protein
MNIEIRNSLLSRWLEGLWLDLMHGISGLCNRPGFTLTAVFSLALGIGANSAIFSVLDGMYLRPPAVEKPEDLVRLFSTNPDGSDINTSVQDYRDFCERTRTLSGIVSRKDMFVSFRSGTQSRFLTSLVVSENYFDALKPSFAQGRGFTPVDMRDDRTWPAVISYETWKKELEGTPQVIGKDILIENRHFAIEGVLSPQFREIDNFGAAQVYVPLEAWRVIDSTNPDYKLRDVRVLTLLGRKTPAYSYKQVQSELSLIAAQLAGSYPGSNHNIGMRVVPDFQYRVRSTGEFGLLLTVVIGFILLMACVNVAHLLLAQVDRRRKEFALRAALGANRLQLLRQSFAENLLLSFFGSLPGLVLAYAIVHFLPLWRSADVYAPAFQIDFRVIAFAVLLAVLTSILFGLPPAWRASNPDLMQELKGAAANQSAGPLRLRVRNLLIVLQLAVTFVLLAGSALMVKSLRNSINEDLGFPRKNLLTQLVVMGNRSPEAFRRLLDQWVARVKIIPGVKAACIARRVPLVPSVGGHWQEIYVAGSPLPMEQRVLSTSYNSIGLDFLKTIGIPVLRGRDFNQYDTTDSPRVLIISETMARRFWPKDDPLGKEVWLGGRQGQKATVVGIAGDTKVEDVEDSKKPYYYVPSSQDFRPFATLVVESQGDPMSLLMPVRAALSELDPELVSGQVMTLKLSLELKSGDRTRISLLLGMLGTIGLILAVVGLYGIISYVANHRTKEIGIRMALGAKVHYAVWLVLRQGLLLILAGVAIGMAAGLAFTRLIESMLFGVSPVDLTAFLGGAVLLMMVALLACYIPAHRAAGINPMLTLRAE